MPEKLRKVNINSFIMNSLLDEVKTIKEKLEGLQEIKKTKEEEVASHRVAIEGLEAELDSIGENIKILKENKADLVEKAEEVKKEINL